MNPVRSQKMKILVDFDRTIFQTKRLIEQVEKLLDKHGMDKALWRAVWPKAEHEYNHQPNYTIWRHLELYEQQKKINDKAGFLKDYERLLTHEHLLFPGAIEFLKTAREAGQLILFTKGDREFQMLKVNKLGLAPFYDEIVIVPSSKDRHISELLEDGRQTIFVEDKASEVDSVKQNHPEVTTIRVRHKGDFFSGEDSKLTDYEVENLKQAGEIIKKLAQKKGKR